MKSTLSLIFIIFVLFFKAQETNNFIIQNNKIVWQFVYPTNLNYDQIENVFKQVKNIKDVKRDNDVISGKLIKSNIDYSSVGFNANNTPIVVANSVLDADIKLEMKEGKYRVSISNLIMLSIRDYFSGDFHILKSDTTTEFDKYFLKEGDFTYAFKKDSGIIFNLIFLNSFDLNKLNEKTDNW